MDFTHQEVCLHVFAHICLYCDKLYVEILENILINIMMIPTTSPISENNTHVSILPFAIYVLQ